MSDQKLPPWLPIPYPLIEKTMQARGVKQRVWALAYFNCFVFALILIRKGTDAPIRDLLAWSNSKTTTRALKALEAAREWNRLFEEQVKAKKNGTLLERKRNGNRTKTEQENQDSTSGDEGQRNGSGTGMERKRNPRARAPSLSIEEERRGDPPLPPQGASPAPAARKLSSLEKALQHRGKPQHDPLWALEGFEAAWCEWVTWRCREKRSLPSPTAMTKALNKLLGWHQEGHDLIRDVFDHSIGRDWKGLFLNKDATRAQSTRAQSTGGGSQGHGGKPGPSTPTSEDNTEAAKTAQEWWRDIDLALAQYSGRPPGVPRRRTGHVYHLSEDPEMQERLTRAIKAAAYREVRGRFPEAWRELFDHARPDDRVWQGRRFENEFRRGVRR